MADRRAYYRQRRREKRDELAAKQRARREANIEEERAKARQRYAGRRLGENERDRRRYAEKRRQSRLDSLDYARALVAIATGLPPDVIPDEVAAVKLAELAIKRAIRAQPEGGPGQ